MQCYIVGGAVRNLLMGKLPQDVDLAFSGCVEDFLKVYPNAQLVGKSIKVVILNGKEYMPLHNNNILDDLHNRDLTINAFILDAQGMIYAHPQSFFDLKQGILRPASPQAFYNDATRIYRLARFAAAFPHFHLHEEAISQAQAVIKKHQHWQLPGERIGREYLKALHAPKPSLFMEVLQKTQALNPAHAYWFKELTQLKQKQHEKLAQLMDSFTTLPPALNASEHNNFLSLVRHMFLAFTLHEPKENKFEEHPIYKLSTRLALPLNFMKAAFHFANTTEKAIQFQTLSPEEQVPLLLRAEALHISLPYWHALDHLSKKNISSSALNALQIIKNIHLPPKWRNQGKLSGEKLFSLQCEALHSYFS